MNARLQLQLVEPDKQKKSKPRKRRKPKPDEPEQPLEYRDWILSVTLEPGVPMYEPPVPGRVQ